jgi:hypothetical protein
LKQPAALWIVHNKRDLLLVVWETGKELEGVYEEIRERLMQFPAESAI